MSRFGQYLGGVLISTVTLGISGTAMGEPFLAVNICGGPVTQTSDNAPLSNFCPWGGGNIGDGTASNQYSQSLPCQSSGSARVQSISKTFGTDAVYYRDATAPNGLKDAKLPGACAPSGQITVTLKSVDLVFDRQGNGSNLQDGPYIDSSDRGVIPDNGNFSYGQLYRRFVIAMPGDNSLHYQKASVPLIGDGTSHRLLIEFSGLQPNGHYRFKFYAYDDTQKQGVFVFTNVTDNPLRYLNSADAGGNGNLSAVWPLAVTLFNPGLGEHKDGTQYAPDGRYVWVNGRSPASNDQYSVPLDEIANAGGKVVFAETTVVNLYRQYQPFPILNGFELELLPESADGRVTDSVGLHR